MYYLSVKASLKYTYVMSVS